MSGGAAAATDDTSEFVAVKFSYHETTVHFVKQLGVAKWDAGAKAWVLPRADWEVLVSDDNNLPQQIKDATREDWKPVLEATEILREASVEARDDMPHYVFVGGRQRFRQVRR